MDRRRGSCWKQLAYIATLLGWIAFFIFGILAIMRDNVEEEASVRIEAKIDVLVEDVNAIANATLIILDALITAFNLTV